MGIKTLVIPNNQEMFKILNRLSIIEIHKIIEYFYVYKNPHLYLINQKILIRLKIKKLKFYTGLINN